MACYKPLKACLVGPKNGERKLSFKRGSVGEALSLPCGRCIGCKLERSRQWAIRLMHENELHEESSFITLTFDEKNLPEGGSLDVGIVQRFLKRLRKRLAPRRIRFFLCGEYGDRFGRPHYHAVIFGYSFPDKVKLSSGSSTLSYSKELSDIWGFGLCSVGDVTFESASYVASYVTKKITGEKAKEHYQGRKPEFVVMSRGGRKGKGIGAGWIEKFRKDVYPSDSVVVRGKEMRPPRYYDNRLEQESSGDWEAVRLKREVDREKLQEYILVADTLVPIDGLENHPRRLAVRERVAQAKLKLKSRNLEKLS